MKQQGRFLYVTAFAALLLLLETVLFHMVDYLFDYFSATGVISWAVLGIGLGAFAASRIHGDEDRVYLFCSIGATLSLYLTSFVILRYTVVPLIAVCISMLFFFPVMFITLAFKRHPADKVYLFDMAGAGLGVVITVTLYTFLRSEGILLLCLVALPLTGLIRFTRSTTASRASKRTAAIITGSFVLLAGILFVIQVSTDSLNLIRLFRTDGPYDVPKVYDVKDPDRIARSYDSLVGRIDLLTFPWRPNFYCVCYNGYGNDGFGPTRPPEYNYFKKKGIRWPSADQRVLYGLTNEPRIFVIGAAARGVTKSIKKLTPLENITTTEIDPSIVKLMSHDFYVQSGKAYHGLHPIIGNALSVLKSMDHKFDLITLINTHSGRTIGYHSGPDYLHTREAYRLYMDHLSENGYVNFEERPFNRGGELAIYRMINTMWHVLRERGAKDPSRHFFIWDWAAERGAFPRIDLSYVPGTEKYRRRELYYKGMIVTREPIVGKRLEKLLYWQRNVVGGSRVLYLKGILEYGEMSDFFKWLDKGDLSALDKDDFDASIITNDRPFPSLSRNSVPELGNLLIYSAAIFLVLGLMCLIGTIKGADKKHGLMLVLYNTLIGFGYFFIEIMLLQVYQNVFVSPSMTLVLVLGLMLISSGLGGVFYSRIRPTLAASGLIPLALAAVYAPSAMLWLNLPFFLSKVAGVILVGASGFLMGVFFPRGLGLAGAWDMKSKIPYFFAINSVAGSFAVVLALYSGIRFGYSLTMLTALTIYAMSALMIERLSYNEEKHRAGFA
ncbi:MAG: hypothetical protein GXP49_06890 [Deltaproteobacteria bacterium]|nr:hypothetical protein [Deltaproteobacteria bacterium]